jgi:hypothetical protein
VRRRPLQDVGDFRPEGFLLNAVLERIDPGDDEAVELLVTDVAECFVELVDVIGRISWCDAQPPRRARTSRSRRR